MFVCFGGRKGRHRLREEVCERERKGEKRQRGGTDTETERWKREKEAWDWEGRGLAHTIPTHKSPKTYLQPNESVSTAGVHGDGLCRGHRVHKGLHGVLEDDCVLDGPLQMLEKDLWLIAEGLDLVRIALEASVVLGADRLALPCARSKDLGHQSVSSFVGSDRWLGRWLRVWINEYEWIGMRQAWYSALIGWRSPVQGQRIKLISHLARWLKSVGG